MWRDRKRSRCSWLLSEARVEMRSFNVEGRRLRDWTIEPTPPPRATRRRSPLPASPMSDSASDRLLDQDSDRHAAHEDDGRRDAARPRNEARPRAEPSQSPANAEQRGAEDETSIDVLARREMELDVEKG